MFEHWKVMKSRQKLKGVRVVNGTAHRVTIKHTRLFHRGHDSDHRGQGRQETVMKAQRFQLDDRVRGCRNI